MLPGEAEVSFVVDDDGNLISVLGDDWRFSSFGALNDFGEVAFRIL